MKVEMEVVKSATHQTKALQPRKPLMIDERWVDRLEKMSKGRIRRIPVSSAEVALEEEVTLPRKRKRTSAGTIPSLEE